MTSVGESLSIWCLDLGSYYEVVGICDGFFGVGMGQGGCLGSYGEPRGEINNNGVWDER